MAIKVLIVDDSKAVRVRIINYLGDEFEIEEAEDGSEALHKLESIKEIGLLILDINMPAISGIEVVQEIAKRDNLTKVPTIILTTETDRYMKAKMRIYSFVKCWIIKPLTQKSMSAALEKIFPMSFKE